MIDGGQVTVEAVDGGWTLRTVEPAAGLDTLQRFDADWVMQGATVVRAEGGGRTVTEQFDGDWTRTAAVVDVLTPLDGGGELAVRSWFTGDWEPISSRVTRTEGLTETVEYYDGDWALTAAEVRHRDAGGDPDRFTLERFDDGWSLQSVQQWDDGRLQGTTFHVRDGEGMLWGHAPGRGAPVQDVFHLQAGQTDGDSVQLFNRGDVLVLEGYAAGAQLTHGAGDLWTVTDGARTESFHLVNGPAELQPGEWLFA